MKIDTNAFRELKVYIENISRSDSPKLTVISAYSLGKVEKTSLASFLKKQGLGEVTLIEKVDSSVLGGVILVGGSTIIDLSLRGQLSSLKKDLYEIT